jgi:hypothetical protein
MPATRATKARGGATAASAAATALPGVTSADRADPVARGAADVRAVSEVLVGPAPADRVPAATVDRVPVARVVLVARVVVGTVVLAPVAGPVSLGIPARDPGAMVATVDVAVRTSVRNR